MVKSAIRTKALPSPGVLHLHHELIRLELPAIDDRTDIVVIDDVILSPRPKDWRSYLETAPVASDAFMAEVEDLPVQKREH